MRRPAWAWYLFALLAVVPGAALAADVLAGRAVLPERASLPAGSQFEVAFVDLAALDEDERVLGSLRVDNPVLPLHFTVPFDRSRLTPAHRYVLRAVVHENGVLVYAGEKPVAARGPFAPLTVALAAAEAPPPATAAAPVLLVRSEWRAVELDGEKLKDGESAPTLAFAEDGRVSGFAGCNRLMGHYELAEPALKVSAVGLTRMACPAPAMTLEGRFVAALAAVTAVRSATEQLELRDAAGTVRLRLEARHAH